MFKNRFPNFRQYAHFLCLCQLIFIGLSAAPAAAQSTPLKIIILGDSLTSGYQIDPKATFPIMLERKLLSQGHQVQIISKSVAGATTADAVKQVDEIISQAPDLVVLQVGLNDALKGLDLRLLTIKNLNYMVDRINKKGIGVLLTGTLPPANLSKRDADFYRGMFYSIAKANKVSLYPDILKGLENRPDLSLADGLHPNEKGVLTMVHNITPTMERLVDWRLKYRAYKETYR